MFYLNEAHTGTKRLWDKAMPAKKVPVVLVVEDEPLVRLHTIGVVKNAGFEAIGARHADEAVHTLEARNDIRLVITDVMMPGSMDGLRLANVIRDRWPPINLILISANRIAVSDIPERGKFFSKPFNDRQIEQALRDFLC